MAGPDDPVSQAGDSHGSTVQFANSTTSVLATLAALAEVSAPLSGSDSDTGKTEEAGEGNPVDSAIQEVVGSGGQHVIAIVSDSIALGSLQTALPSSGLSQPFILSMQDGQQVLTVPAAQVAEETALEDREYAEEEDQPVAKKQKVAQNAHDSGEDKDSVEREVLQQQLQEANRKAQEYRSQLLKKEQEAEEYRLRLAAMGREQAVLGQVTQAEPPVVASEDIKESVLSMLGTDQTTDSAVETAAS